MNLPSDALAPAYRWFAVYSILCPIGQTRRSQGEARWQLHPANSEFPAEATSLLDHKTGPACADYSSTRPCFVESTRTDSRQHTIHNIFAQPVGRSRPLSGRSLLLAEGRPMPRAAIHRRWLKGRERPIRIESTSTKLNPFAFSRPRRNSTL